MLPTPSTLHVPFERVYEPAEDSFLLLDTLSSDSEKVFLQNRFAPQHTKPDDSPLIAEIGTGSGVVLAFVTANAGIIFGRADISTVGVDINIHACEATEKTIKIAIEEQQSKGIACGAYMGNRIGDLTAPLTPGSVDVLIFNPPYVPTAELPAIPQEIPASNGFHDALSKPTFEEDSHFLELSYAGGIDGMETTNRLLQNLPEILSSPSGVAYILLCAQNKPEDVKERIRAWGGGWMAETVRTSGMQAGWEKLQIIRIWRE